MSWKVRQINEDDTYFKHSFEAVDEETGNTETIEVSHAPTGYHAEQVLREHMQKNGRAYTWDYGSNT